MSDKEHSTATLGDSEVACVENPPLHAVPEVGQRSKNDAEVPTAVRGEQPGYVLDEQPGGSKSLCDSGVLVEEAGAVSGEAASLAGDADVLAGESSGEEINRSVVVPWTESVFAVSASSQRSQSSGLCAFWALRHVSDVRVDSGVGPVGGEDIAPPRVLFGEEDVLESGACEAEV
jgi:hypothetical protein